jgi:hypothetical protein
MRRLMRFVLPCLVCAALLMPAIGCKRSRKPRVEVVEEDGSSLTSTIEMADTRTAVQLVKGFHELEGNSWRWTLGRFAVTLKVPEGAAQSGAQLELRLTVPGVTIEKLGATTLSASVNGLAIEPEKYVKPGEVVYLRAIPASALTGEAVTVDFALDKFFAAGQVEQRELGVIVTAVGLTAK